MGYEFEIFRFHMHFYAGEITYSYAYLNGSIHQIRIFWTDSLKKRILDNYHFRLVDIIFDTGTQVTWLSFEPTLQIHPSCTDVRFLSLYHTIYTFNPISISNYSAQRQKPKFRSNHVMIFGAFKPEASYLFRSPFHMLMRYIRGILDGVYWRRWALNRFRWRPPQLHTAQQSLQSSTLDFTKIYHLSIIHFMDYLRL